VSQLEHVFIRGSRVRFMIIPDMLKNAPMFKRLEARIRVCVFARLVLFFPP
jgi:small nuclear ribonucleoprotein D3